MVTTVYLLVALVVISPVAVNFFRAVRTCCLERPSSDAILCDPTMAWPQCTFTPRQLPSLKLAVSKRCKNTAFTTGS